MTFSVTVNTPDTGDHVLDNFVVPTGTDPPPECLPTDPTCTTHPVPAIAIDKTSTATQIVPGSQVPYTLTVTNTGPIAATDVVVTDPLPVGLTFVSSVPPCTAAGQLVTCNLGTLDAGTDATIQLVTQAADPFPAESIDPDGTVPNTAMVTAPDTNCEPETAMAGRMSRVDVGRLLQQVNSDECEDDHPLPVSPTIAITKTSTATEFAPGGEVPYVITVRNTGPVVARNVVVTDDLPVGLTFVSSVPSCTAAGQMVTCPMGDLARGATATIDFVTRAADPFPTESLVNGEIVNVAVVSGTDSNCEDGSTDPVCTDDFALPPTPAAESGGNLPFTGSTLSALIQAGVVALLGGAMLMRGSRRRRMTRRTWRANLRP